MRKSNTCLEINGFSPWDSLRGWAVHGWGTERGTQKNPGSSLWRKILLPGVILMEANLPDSLGEGFQLRPLGAEKKRSCGSYPGITINSSKSRMLTPCAGYPCVGNCGEQGKSDPCWLLHCFHSVLPPLLLPTLLYFSIVWFGLAEELKSNVTVTIDCRTRETVNII